MTRPYRPSQQPRHSIRGFTLIEMLFVVLLIGTLATLVLPNYRTSQLKAQAADVLGRIEAINVAIKGYEADHQALAPFTGPVGSAPDFLTAYTGANYFAGPADITFQLTRTDVESPPQLVIAANGDSEQQILLAAGQALGPARAVIVGGGTSLIVTMAD
jgi:prepilin-type N-terminal cleavage/methylation domain-containing protein